ncbi:MAG: hypothetical protein ACI84C_001187 [Flavobacteriales bacterium]|jgi:hypothetical protein
MVAIQRVARQLALQLAFFIVFGFLIVNQSSAQQRAKGSHLCKSGKVSWYVIKKDPSDNERSETVWDLLQQPHK